jgi:NAD(P)-dependent dehydrogenase (short-subunit alcohol dehydrogenase family)
MPDRGGIGARVKVAVHYFSKRSCGQRYAGENSETRSDGSTVQADVLDPDQISRMFRQVKSEFGKLDIFVSNARPEVPAFFQAPMEISLKQWDAAFDSQAKAFLVGTREAANLMGEDGRIFALTYAEGSRTGGLQPWVGMGSAKAALESLVRYFAVALARLGITVNAVSPGWTEDSVLNTLPEQAQTLIRNWHVCGWTPMGWLGTPEDVGDVVTLLCSERACWITGQVIYADGGACLMNPEVPTEIQLG